MEWGPRALGNRSILGDPRVKNMRELLNLKIKRREEFRPFAPSVLEERSKEYFEIDEKCEYMEKVFRAKKGVEKIIPAVVHVDQTSRVQTVSQNTNIKFYSLIKSFGDKTGVPILLNTSLNVNEPICKNPENARNFYQNINGGYGDPRLGILYEISYWEISNNFIIFLLTLSIFFSHIKFILLNLDF